MIIDSLYIERFGVLRDKRLDKIRPDVEMIYAPNETGKTTFLQFIRCMLFGLHGGRAYASTEPTKLGGRLTFRTPIYTDKLRNSISGRLDNPSSQTYTITRSLRCSCQSTLQNEAEQIELVNGQKELQSLGELQKILGDVDSKVYSQIFAITQDDLHSFDLLSSQVATRVLYQLSLAQGQNSLTELSARLESKRRELLNNIIDDAHPKDGKLKELILHRQELMGNLEIVKNRHAQRQQLQEKIPELKSKLTQIQKQLEDVQNQQTELEHLERAYPIFEQWQQTDRLRKANGESQEDGNKKSSWFSWGSTNNNSNNIATKSNSPIVTDYALEQSRKLESELANLQSRLRSMQAELQRLPEDKPIQKINPAPVKAEIPENVKALQSKRSDFVRLRELELQKKQLDDKLQAVWDTLDLPGECNAGGFPNRETLIALQSVWEKKDETVQVEYEEEIPVETNDETNSSEQEQHLKSAMNSYSPETADKLEYYKGQLKATKEYLVLLRDKLRWLERRNDLEWGETQLRNRLTILTTTPPISTTMKYSLIAVTSLGVLGLILWTFYLFGWIAKESLLGSLGTFGVILCFCGLAGVVIMRYLLEKSAEERLIDCRIHWETTKNQLDEHLSLLPDLETRLRNCSSVIDLPTLLVGESPDEMADTRHAINELINKSREIGKTISELERNVAEIPVIESKPIDTPKTVYQTIKRYRTEKKYTNEQFQQTWSQVLQRYHFPTSWTIVQVQMVLHRIAWFNKQFENRNNLERQIQTFNGTLASYRNQLNNLIQKYNLTSSGYTESELIDNVVLYFTQNQTASQSVTVTTPQVNPRRIELQKNITQLEENIRLTEGKSQYIFNEYTVHNRSELEALYRQQKQFAEREQKNKELIQKQTEQFQRIQKALNRPITDDKELYSIFQQYPDSRSVSNQKNLLIQKNEQLRHTKQQFEQELTDLQHQHDSNPNNDILDNNKQTLGQLESQINHMAQQWRALAMAQKITDSLVQQYETTRQPETLAWASEYFQSMTNGEYEQILKPSDERPLMIQRTDGKLFTVGHLSTGTREELYLSLRLALVSWYAQQGIALPLILDDAMANFDSVRAKCAAKTILKVAQQGIQIILLTCHKSVRDAFEKCDVEVRKF